MWRTWTTPASAAPAVPATCCSLTPRRAAGGIAGGYHLPITAAFMVLGVGGPPRAMLTCMAAIVTAAAAGAAVQTFVERLHAAVSRERRAAAR